METIIILLGIKVAILKVQPKAGMVAAIQEVVIMAEDIRVVPAVPAVREVLQKSLVPDVVVLAHAQHVEAKATGMQTPVIIQVNL